MAINIKSKAQATRAKAFLLTRFKTGVSYDGEEVRNAVHLSFLRPDQIWLHLETKEQLYQYEQNMFDLTNGRSKGTSAIATEVDQEEMI